MQQNFVWLHQSSPQGFLKVWQPLQLDQQANRSQEYKILNVTDSPSWLLTDGSQEQKHEFPSQMALLTKRSLSWRNLFLPNLIYYSHADLSNSRMRKAQCVPECKGKRRSTTSSLKPTFLWGFWWAVTGRSVMELSSKQDEGRAWQKKLNARPTVARSLQTYSSAPGV